MKQAGVALPGTHELPQAFAIGGHDSDHLFAQYPGTVTLQPLAIGIRHSTRSAVAPSGRSLIRGIRFIGFDWAIDLATGPDVEHLVIEDCEFIDCNRAINGWQDEPTMSKGPSLGYVTIRHCRVIGAKEAGFKIHNRFRGMVIEDCTFHDCHAPCIVVGNNHEQWQDVWRDAIIRRNTLVRTWSERDAIGIQAYGVGHLIEDNTIMFNSTRELGTAEGIYCKMMHGCVRNNLCLNAGGYEAQICLKGAAENEAGVKGGFNRVHANEIHRTGRVPHRPHDRAVMVRADRETRVFKNLHTGESSILIKSAAASGGSKAIDNWKY